MWKLLTAATAVEPG